jgi:hypothetical protein
MRSPIGKRGFVSLRAVLGLAFVVSAVWLPASAHYPGVVLSGAGSATIDGVLSTGEWDHAGSINFPVNVPIADGGGTTAATLYVMNDASNLYLALKIARASFGGVTQLDFEFDNNHDGAKADGDDLLFMSVGVFSPPMFADDFRYTCPGDVPGSAGCAPGDTVSAVGFPPPGSTDGATAATNNGVFTTIELSHPLNSADDAHDFSLALGDTVGFTLNVNLSGLVPGSVSSADTYFPTCLSCAMLFADIIVASDVVPVVIDIKPAGWPNSINPGSHGAIPVAILSTPVFDAVAQVDTSSLTFGRMGDELSLAFCSRFPEDANADGLMDQVCHFRTGSAMFRPGDTQGILKGKTVNGEPILGADSVRIVPPPWGSRGRARPNSLQTDKPASQPKPLHPQPKID